MTKRLITPEEAQSYIRQAVLRHYEAKVELAEERRFQHWQNETVFPAAVNRWTHDIGEEIK